MPEPPAYVGIDVAKDHLDIHALPSGAAWRATNAPEAIDALAGRLTALAPALIVMEATGGHEHAVAGALATAGLAVAVVNPRQVRDFARATGGLAKTDALDARASGRPRPLRRAGTAGGAGAPRRRPALAGGAALPAAPAHREAGRRAEPVAARRRGDPEEPHEARPVAGAGASGRGG